jgi:glycosyltransferase involved in cell wall biosynthesis
VHVVPLAASLPTGSVEPQEVLARLRIQPPYILSVGTLEPRKNLVRLVRAYRRAASRGVTHSLALVGPMGWRAGELLREVAGDGPGRVAVTGPVPAEDLDALYRGASAFAFPSLYEGFGLPVVEAMARGVPCVVSTSSSVPEVAGEAALPVDPRSVAGLADALERVVSDHGLAARLRDAGRRRAAQFTWDRTARQTMEVYKSVLEGP